MGEDFWTTFCILAFAAAKPNVGSESAFCNPRKMWLRPKNISTYTSEASIPPAPPQSHVVTALTQWFLRLPQFAGASQVERALSSDQLREQNRPDAWERNCGD